jgi:hypothetical protein
MTGTCWCPVLDGHRVRMTKEPEGLSLTGDGWTCSACLTQILMVVQEVAGDS